MNPKTICAYPFVHMDIEPDGEIQFCCAVGTGKNLDNQGNKFNVTTHSISESWNSDSMKTLRTNLINGVEDPRCNFCWERERNKTKSYRTGGFTTFPLEKIKDRIEKAAANNGHVSQLPFDYQVATGNLCNLGCKMCGSKWSTNNAKFFKRFHDTPAEINFVSSTLTKPIGKNEFQAEHDWPVTIGLEKIFEGSYDAIRLLYLTGGEPTIIKEVHDFLEKLVEQGYADKIRIRPNTNCTTINKKFLDTLSKFSAVDLIVSIDGMDEIADIQRTFSDWPTILKNLDTIMAWWKEKRTPGLLTINTIITSLNLHHVIDLWVFLCERYPGVKFGIGANTVWDAEVNFGVNSVPEDAVEKIKQYSLSDNYKTNPKYKNMKMAYSYLENLLNTSTFVKDYAIIHYCLNKMKEYHPEYDIEKIYRIYF